MTEHETVNAKIKAHLIEFPHDKAADVASLFNVNAGVVYNALEYLRRHKMIERAGKGTGKKKAKHKVTYSPPAPTEEKEVTSALPLVHSLNAEIARLNAIISYLESRIGFK